MMLDYWNRVKQLPDWYYILALLGMMFILAILAGIFLETVTKVLQ